MGQVQSVDENFSETARSCQVACYVVAESEIVRRYQAARYVAVEL